MRDSSRATRSLNGIRLSAAAFALSFAGSGCVIVTEHPVDSTPPTPPPKATASAATPSASATPVAAVPVNAGASDAKPLPKPNPPK